MSNVDPKLLSQVRYRCIGPSRGGRAVAVAADPVKRNVFYFGAVAGGVWKSDDAGQYWQNITDGFLTTSSIGALAVAPSDGNVIYAGTGETTIRIDITHGDGMYKSTDAGVTWQHIGLRDTRHIGEIRVHPSDPDLVYVAALGHASKDNPDRGLYRTKDGGATWELVLHVSDGAGAVDVALDPNNPRIVFATIWQARRTFWSINSGGPDCGLWRSKDGGDTWENISTKPGMAKGTLGKIGVSVSPAKSGRVFALVEAEGRTRGLYRSDDHGETWEHVSKKPDLQWRPWYYMHVIAHPTDADTVFVMNMKAWKSIDGGKNFDEWLTPHGDNHALWIDPHDPDRMIGCDDGGAWVSLNAGDSWSTIYNQLTAQFYHVATDDQYPYMVYGSQQDNSSIAVPSRTNTGAITWGNCYPPGTAESGYVAPKPNDPNIVYVGAIGSSPGGGDALQRYDHRTKQIQLVSVWPEAYHDGNTAEVRFQWTYPIVFSPQDSNVLYAAGNKVFRSVDEGHSWEAISPDLTYADPETMGVSGPLTMDTAGAEMYATIFSLMVSRHEQGVLMAGSDDGRVHVSLDDGGSWAEVTPPDLEKFSQITMIEESPHTAGTVYMTVARHKHGDYAAYVYRSTDLGGSWERIDGGIPENHFCRVIREDPSRRGLLYVGTELGIWVSFDDGANWQSLQCNLPVTPVYDFVVATHGRSFWILDDLSQLRQIHDELAESSNHLFAPRDTVRMPTDLFGAFWGSPGGKNYHVTFGQNATYYVDEDETGRMRTRILDAGADIERGVRITYLLHEDATGTATLTISDGDGKEIATYSSAVPEDKKERAGNQYIPAKEGMNEFLWEMNYPAGVKMTDTDFHGRPAGPLAMPGAYRATLTVGDWSMTQPFELVKDPRVTTSDADLAEQFELLLRIQAKLSETATAVNRIRAVRKQIADWTARLDGDERADDFRSAAAGLLDELTAIEHQLVQVEFTSDGDSLNYREMLFEKLGGLTPIVGSADARPTVQSHRVYAKLAGQIDEQIAALGMLLGDGLAGVNSRLVELDVDIISA
jgi:Sortilin, neurotensin receptor 3,